MCGISQRTSLNKREPRARRKSLWEDTARHRIHTTRRAHVRPSADKTIE